MRKFLIAIAATAALVTGAVMAAPASAIVQNGYDVVTFKPWSDEAAKLTITNYPKGSGQEVHVVVTGDCCLPRAVSVNEVWIAGRLVWSGTTKGTVERFYYTSNPLASISVKAVWTRGGDFFQYKVTRST